ncbi:MAG: reverse transcriptase family protein [Saprospiraceae bacterium]
MSQQPRTRQELYDLIRSTSREEFILTEMKRLGFWKTNTEKPSLPEKIMERRAELSSEMKVLVAQNNKVKNPEKLLQEYRKKRLKESREKQKANREKREQERQAKAANWKSRKEKEVLYLGEDISIGLHFTETNNEQLEKFGLPKFSNEEELATAMNLKIGHLRFLAYNRKVSKVSHYKRFYMQKKSGGKRLISAPMPLLKHAQYWIQENILDKIPTHESAHGFKKERSIVSNALPHLKQDVVVNHDFKGFFPTVNFKRVKGVFHNLGYSEKLATIFAALCTEPDVDLVKMDGIKYFVAKGERVLPQGAPTSPVLTNILCYKMDKRLAGVAKSLDFKYTRYADDLTFSASGEAKKNLYKLLWRMKSVTTDEGFNLHPDKLRIMHKGGRQEVTGIVVNRELGICRKTMRKFRALLHQIGQTGWEGKKWGTSPNIIESVWGYANFVFMVKPEKGKALLEEVKSLMKKSGVEKPTSKNPISLEKKIKEEQSKIKKNKEEGNDKPGWKMF